MHWHAIRYKVSQKSNPRLKDQCSQDIKMLKFANILFDSGHDQKHFKMYPTEIGHSVLKWRTFSSKPLQKTFKTVQKSWSNFLKILYYSNDLDVSSRWYPPGRMKLPGIMLLYFQVYHFYPPKGKVRAKSCTIHSNSRRRSFEMNVICRLHISTYTNIYCLDWGS